MCICVCLQILGLTDLWWQKFSQPGDKPRQQEVLQSLESKDLSSRFLPFFGNTPRALDCLLRVR